MSRCNTAVRKYMHLILPANAHCTTQYCTGLRGIAAVTACWLVVCLFGAQARAEGGDSKNLSGIWWSEKPTKSLKPDGEGAPPLTAAGKELYKTTSKATLATLNGPRNKNDIGVCAPFGVPRIWTQPFPFQILQKKDLVVIVYEHNRVFRLVYMDAPLPDPDKDDPAFQGHSVGRWDGDTLVIESLAFNDKTVLDDTGLPHSEHLKVTERLRKSGKDKLEVTVKIQDPTIYTQAWTTKMTFAARPDAQIEEYICGQGEFDTRLTRQRK